MLCYCKTLGKDSLNKTNLVQLKCLISLTIRSWSFVPANWKHWTLLSVHVGESRVPSLESCTTRKQSSLLGLLIMRLVVPTFILLAWSTLPWTLVVSHLEFKPFSALFLSKTSLVVNSTSMHSASFCFLFAFCVPHEPSLQLPFPLKPAPQQATLTPQIASPFFKNTFAHHPPMTGCFKINGRWHHIQCQLDDPFTGKKHVVKQGECPLLSDCCVAYWNPLTLQANKWLKLTNDVSWVAVNEKQAKTFLTCNQKSMGTHFTYYADENDDFNWLWSTNEYPSNNSNLNSLVLLICDIIATEFATPLYFAKGSENLCFWRC